MDELKFDNSNVANYQKIVKNLNQYQYVPFYRSFQKSNIDLSQFNINTSNDSMFLQDSLKFNSSRKVFFQQDIAIVYWLLSFEKDTSDAVLWREFQNPLSSFIDFNQNKSKSALNLMLSYLDGVHISDFRYNYYKYCVKGKYLTLYNEVKLFLLKNKNLTNKEIRRNWKIKKRLLTSTKSHGLNNHIREARVS
jgi:hypothetical protein